MFNVNSKHQKTDLIALENKVIKIKNGKQKKRNIYSYKLIIRNK